MIFDQSKQGSHGVRLKKSDFNIKFSWQCFMIKQSETGLNKRELVIGLRLNSVFFLSGMYYIIAHQGNVNVTIWRCVLEEFKRSKTYRVFVWN